MISPLPHFSRCLCIGCATVIGVFAYVAESSCPDRCLFTVNQACAQARPLRTPYSGVDQMEAAFKMAMIGATGSISNYYLAANQSARFYGASGGFSTQF